MEVVQRVLKEAEFRSKLETLVNEITELRESKPRDIITPKNSGQSFETTDDSSDNSDNENGEIEEMEKELSDIRLERVHETEEICVSQVNMCVYI